MAVALEDLPAKVEEYGPTAFVLTVNKDGLPRATHVRVAVEGSNLACEVGAGTAANARSRGGVALLWPPTEPGGFSLIVDGDASVPAERQLSIRPSSAVLHRPA